MNSFFTLSPPSHPIHPPPSKKKKKVIKNQPNKKQQQTGSAQLARMLFLVSNCMALE